MRSRFICIVMLLAAAFAAQPALACMTFQPLEQKDVRNADIVVVGRIANYRHVREGEFGNQARFDILVDEVLKGKSQPRLTVSWQRSMYGEPDTMAAGAYLIALDYLPSGQGSSASSSGAKVPLTVRNPMCTLGFLFPATSSEAVAIKRLLTRK